MNDIPVYDVITFDAVPLLLTPIATVAALPAARTAGVPGKPQARLFTGIREHWANSESPGR